MFGIRMKLLYANFQCNYTKKILNVYLDESIRDLS